MLAAELGNDAIVALLAQNNANLRLQDAEGKGEQKQASLFAMCRCYISLQIFYALFDDRCSCPNVAILKFQAS